MTTGMGRKENEENCPLLTANDYYFENDCDNPWGHRSKSITAGATTVISKWPGFLSNFCFLCTVSTIAFVLISLTLIYTNTRFLIPVCFVDTNQSNSIYVHHLDSQWLPNQFDALKAIAQTFPNTTIIVYDLENDLADNNTVSVARNTAQNSTTESDTSYQLRKVSPTLIIIQIPLSEFFKNTPLKLTWRRINDSSLLLLNAEVLNMWRSGGIALDLPKNATDSFDYKIIYENFAKRYRELPRSMTLLDKHAIGTKISCHTTFANLMNKLKKGHFQSRDEALGAFVKQFCTAGSGFVKSEYCDKPFILPY